MSPPRKSEASLRIPRTNTTHLPQQPRTQPQSQPSAANAGLRQAEWDRLKPHLARANLAFYASEYLRGPDEPPYNGKFMTVEHHEEWADLVNRHKRLCINAARGHGKSFFYTMAYPIWMAEKNPGKQGFIFSGSQPQAELILTKIQQEIEGNPKLAHLKPDLRLGARKMWSTKQMRLANGFELYARGYGTKVRGVHPVFVICDDILNDEDAYSDNVRGKNIDYFFSAIRNTVGPEGQIIVVGTPFHRSDLYGVLANNKEYVFKRYPAVIDEGTIHERALWPERFPLAYLKKLRNEIGAIRFSRENMCNPRSDDMSLFPSYLFRGDPVEQYNVKLGMPYGYWAAHGIKNIVFGVDFAVSSNVGSDYTVVFVLGVDDQGNRWIIDIIRERGLTFKDQQSMIVNAARRYRPSLIYTESNQCQRIFGDELIRLTDLPIKLFHTGDAKHSLEQGIPSLKLLLENHKVRIPRGADAEVLDIWIDEMQSMSFDGGRVFSAGEHDDCAMSWWIANQAIRDGNFSFVFEAQEGDDAAYDEEMKATFEPPEEESLEEDEFVLGAEPQGRGRPKRVNAQLVNAMDLESLDQDPPPGAESQTMQSKLRPYSEVKPQLGSPKATFFGNGR